MRHSLHLIFERVSPFIVLFTMERGIGFSHQRVNSWLIMWWSRRAGTTFRAAMLTLQGFPRKHFSSTLATTETLHHSPRGLSLLSEAVSPVVRSLRTSFSLVDKFI
jgi:hypothetical protein